MKKLSKAQERTLEHIKAEYTSETIQKGIAYYEERLADPERESMKSWYLDHKEMYENGYILFASPNSRTLEILAELGYIEYIKKERWFSNATPIDWVKLL